jgi:hypothetical protein
LLAAGPDNCIHKEKACLGLRLQRLGIISES